jgi:hypothetical protein
MTRTLATEALVSSLLWIGTVLAGGKVNYNIVPEFVQLKAGIKKCVERRP